MMKMKALTLPEFNQANETTLYDFLAQCCTSQHWIQCLMRERPYDSVNDFKKRADFCWQQMTQPDLLEAFSGHPQIGDISTLQQKYQHNEGFSQQEQQSVESASNETINALAKANEEYLAKFGFIFIVCATGKTAQQMLELLNDRLPNSREIELGNAAEEQRKIFQLRIDKLLHE
ncbi:2-oxo-4-hydroxy-4-carboxy-5-ureidoimidazoline decarboxylase [Flocculibacter collagenilyticus]|uniref:2-oxo-4-hydroxy-4-carboxy-5-ureidoimidazoline decarboxylase n=1 Tax=Flocculibacter collagenilyticus TaxID=2744479 RepID=UPI001F3DFA84|nr:2-oxo-4-hydroxy-4-carboxy-5-ureidoimidazoline decarboxylase [Flocculibacter collagenilyticus]